jgi:hypothetical protein
MTVHIIPWFGSFMVFNATLINTIIIHTLSAFHISYQVPLENISTRLAANITTIAVGPANRQQNMKK